MAINFTGASGAKVDIGNPSSLQITGAMTVMCWIKLDSSSLNIDIFSKYKSSPRGWTLQTDDDPPSTTWGIFLIAKTSSTMMSSGWTASSLAANTWYHLAGMYNPSTAVQVWLNGALSNEKTTAVPATQYDPANNVTLGNRPDGSQGLDGKMDDARIYNRVLSTPEMETIYAARGKDGIVDGLVSRWIMNEDNPGAAVSGSNSVIDLMNNANHGTPSGSNTYFGSGLTLRR